MNKKLKQNFLIMAAGLCVLPASAQLSSNPNKFLGNITTDGNVEFGSAEKYYQLWNQITPENETKWDAIEGSGRGKFTFDGADRSANYAKQHNFPFKYHTLIWGSQYAGWITDLSVTEQYKAIVEYFDGVKAHYPDLEIIDVVNEAINETGAVHAPAPYRAALGGEGRTGYDWIIKAFQLAHERWPNAILVYNDFNTFQWNTDQFIRLVQALRDSGAPIDAYGCQSHDLTDITLDKFKSAMKKLQDELKMPMYSTEFDIGTNSDSEQETQYKNLFPVLWEADYCAGVTLWGWIYGHTWTGKESEGTRGNSGLIRETTENGKKVYVDRPAMTWLREYMASDKAKNAKSPFPNFKKEASVYVKPASMKVANGDKLPVWVDATLATKTIERVELYMGSALVDTKTDAPYLFEVSATSTGTKTLKAIVTATDGSTYERLSRITVQSGTTKREPYNETVPTLPCTIKAGGYDRGISGVAYSGVMRNTDKINVNTSAWMEYTVDVAEEGDYSLDIEVASANDGGMFHLVDNRFGDMIFLTDFTEIPNTGSTTDFVIVRCPLKERLTPGRHVFCLNIDNGGFYVKSLSFKQKTTFSLPGIVEAEDFYQGGNGFNILSGNNSYVISNTATDASVDFSVNVIESGKYSYEATVSSVVSDAKFMVDLISSNGTSKRLGAVTVPNTGNKDTYTVKKAAFLNKITETGQQTLRFTVTQGSCNIDKVKFISANPSGIDEVENDDAASTPAYNLYGMPVNTGYRGIVIKNGKKILRNK